MDVLQAEAALIRPQNLKIRGSSTKGIFHSELTNFGRAAAAAAVPPMIS
jgi:hypothetical protein